MRVRVRVSVCLSRTLECVEPVRGGELVAGESALGVDGVAVVPVGKHLG